jgi:hypothetical protein
VAQSNLSSLLLERGAVEVAGLVSRAYCFDSGLFCLLEPDKSTKKVLQPLSGHQTEHSFEEREL